MEQLPPLDSNGDGLITKDENPKRMQSLILGRLDTNEDNAIDREELAKLSQKKEKQ